MAIKESGEMYLETIFILKTEKPSVRSVDIVESMNYSKSSVSKAVGILKEAGYITVDEQGVIDFTEMGFVKAKSIYDRHKILTNFLIKIGVSEEVAEDDACKIEHHVSKETLECIKKFVKN